MTEKIKIWTTPTARAKIKEIYNYSCSKWDKKTAKKYLAGLEETIKSVARGRKTTKINREFSIRFSYCATKRHYIFFEHQQDKLIGCHDISYVHEHSRPNDRRDICY